MAQRFERIELPHHDPGSKYDIAMVNAALAEAIPHSQILSKGPEFAEFGKDTSLQSALPELVVSTHEVCQVQHVLHVADHFCVPVYPRGLGSGLSGGAVPVRGGIVLDTSPMVRLLEVTPGNRSCTVQPGLTVEKLNQQLKQHKLWFPPWPSSHDISSIGGNIAENAGGITTVKYGTTKHWLLGLTLALPGGELLKTGCMATKDVAGFDLTSLVCGSEGMLGVVVEATLKLVPSPGAVGTAVYSFPTDEAAIMAAQAVIASNVTPRTLEFMDSSLIGCVVKQLGDEAIAVLGEAGKAGAVLALETDAHTCEDAKIQLLELGRLLEAGGGKCIGSTMDRDEAMKLWRVRSELSPACHQLGEYKISDDVCVPRQRMLEFVQGAKQVCTVIGLDMLNYGHVGDGNFHVTLMFKDTEDPLVEKGHEAIAGICKLAVGLGGSISGEHGIGSAKAGLLYLQCDEGALEIMRGIKASFDPKGIMNPGKWL